MEYGLSIIHTKYSYDPDKDEIEETRSEECIKSHSLEELKDKVKLIKPRHYEIKKYNTVTTTEIIASNYEETGYCFAQNFLVLMNSMDIYKKYRIASKYIYHNEIGDTKRDYGQDTVDEIKKHIQEYLDNHKDKGISADISVSIDILYEGVYTSNYVLIFSITNWCHPEFEAAYKATADLYKSVGENVRICIGRLMDYYSLINPMESENFTKYIRTILSPKEINMLKCLNKSIEDIKRD